jgi:DNA-binding CsgD family transcriptional regulator
MARRLGIPARPLVVVEGSPAAVRPQVQASLAIAEAAGWRVVHGWAAPLTGELVVCTGSVKTADDARRALLAAVSGAGLVVGAGVAGDVVARFVDDLRRLGPVDHRLIDTGAPRQLAATERALLGLIGEGLTINEAAAAIGVSRRTADRRLASARQALGVESTTAAICAARSGGR